MRLGNGADPPIPLRSKGRSANRHLTNAGSGTPRRRHNRRKPISLIVQCSDTRLLRQLLRQANVDFPLPLNHSVHSSRNFSSETAWTLVNDRQGDERPLVMASPWPTRYAPRSQAFSLTSSAVHSVASISRVATEVTTRSRVPAIMSSFRARCVSRGCSCWPSNGGGGHYRTRATTTASS
jgi:hypothetical protein